MIGLFLLLGLAPQAASTPAPAPVGWTYKESTDPAAPRTATASVRSADGNARLALRCDTADKPIVSVQYLARPPVPAGKPRIVQVMLDHKQADNATWYFPGQGAVNLDAPEVYLLAKEIADAKNVGIAFDDGTGKGVGNDFAGPGDDAMFRKVYAVCGIPYEMPSATAGVQGKK